MHPPTLHNSTQLAHQPAAQVKPHLGCLWCGEVSKSSLDPKYMGGLQARGGEMTWGLTIATQYWFSKKIKNFFAYPYTSKYGFPKNLTCKLWSKVPVWPWGCHSKGNRLVYCTWPEHQTNEQIHVCSLQPNVCLSQPAARPNWEIYVCLPVSRQSKLPKCQLSIFTDKFGAISLIFDSLKG